MDRHPDRPHLDGVQRWLVGIVAAGAVLIAGIGFAGSYAAVRRLAVAQGFGQFAQVFPIGVDAGIVVLLALDLLLTWLRIPFPLLRYTAWLLTAATIAFNGAAAWPDPIGVGMHGIIPVLFVVCVEAARHATGRVADITADKAMDSIRVARWVLAPWPTFRLWRRMKLWEIRSYDAVVALEQKRLVYRAQLIAEYGRGWRWSAPIEKRMPLRLARYGVPVSGSEGPEPATSDAAETPDLVAAPAPAHAVSAPTPVDPPAADMSPSDDGNSTDKTSDRSGDKTAARKPSPRRPGARGSAAKKRAPRRSLDDWVKLAEPIFHAEFTRQRRNPTANEFATAIGAAGLGLVSDSTAKNIRAEILDRAELPVID